MAKPKLNQVVAIEEGIKKKEFADLTKAHHLFQKTALFSGLIRTYSPRVDGDVVYPEEKTIVQQSAPVLLKKVIEHQSELFDIISTKDRGNCEARIDITVDDKIIAKDVPVTFLIFFEKKLVDLRTLVSKLPVLDPAKEWIHDKSRGMYSTVSEKKLKTKKVQKPVVKYEATKEHPAQTELVSLDEVEGTWNQTDLSTAYPASEIQSMLDRIDKLERAVKIAREQANSIEVDKRATGSELLGYLFQ